VKDDPVFAQDLKLRFVGSCSEEVLESLDENGLTAHMEDLGYLDHEQVSLFQRSAQVLLLTVNQVASAQGIVTGKIFEYMRAGRPVLAIGPTDGDLATIIGETRCGTVVDFQDESGLKRSVLELYRKFKKGILEVNPVNIEKYHRRNLTRELSVLLEEIDGIDKRENSKS
jgi:glycosyltransferase involved in cell wall biosynthesis